MPPRPSSSRPPSADGDASPRDLVEPLFAEAARGCRAAGLVPPRAGLEVIGERGIDSDPRLVRGVLGPLVRRAFTAAAHAAEPSDAPPIREVLVTSVDLGDAIEIEVADSGPWLAEPARAWLAAPSSRRDAAPEHVGLALAAAVAAAERIGGTLTATNCPEGGVAVTLRLPRRQSRRMAA
jgi:sensor histidine kinase regulating citrate/malate metabolism